MHCGAVLRHDLSHSSTSSFPQCRNPLYAPPDRLEQRSTRVADCTRAATRAARSMWVRPTGLRREPSLVAERRWSAIGHQQTVTTGSLLASHLTMHVAVFTPLLDEQPRAVEGLVGEAVRHGLSGARACVHLWRGCPGTRAGRARGSLAALSGGQGVSSSPGRIRRRWGGFVATRLLAAAGNARLGVRRWRPFDAATCTLH